VVHLLDVVHFYCLGATGTRFREANLTFDGTNTLTIGEGTSDSTFSEIIFKVYDGDIGTTGNNTILKAPTIFGAGTRTFELPDIGASATKKLPFWNSGGTTNNAVLTNSSTNYGIDSESNLTYNGTDLTITNGNVNVSSGYGIDFAATANASMTGASMSSELLDDYEEGTWTPLLVSNGIVSTTVGVFSADYTKIGRVVHISAYIDTNTLNTSGTHPVYIQQLPFASKVNSYFAVHIGYASDFSVEHPTAGYIENSGSSTRIVLTKRDAADGKTFSFTSNRLDEEDPDVNAFIFSATYMV